MNTQTHSYRCIFVRPELRIGHHAHAWENWPEPRDPFVCFATSGEADADDDDKSSGGDDEKRFSQADITRIVSREIAKAKKAADKRIADAEAKAKKAEELEARLAEIEGGEGDEGDDAKPPKGAASVSAEMKRMQRELSKLSGQLKSLSDEKKALESERDAAHSNLRSHIVRESLTAALSKANVLPKALPQAVRLLELEAKADLVDDGKGGHAVTLNLDGFETDEIEKAVSKWLKTNDHFVRAEGGGTGSRAPNAGNGNGMRVTEDMLNTMSPEAIIESAMRAQANTE